MGEKYLVQIIYDEIATTYTINLTHKEYEKVTTDKAFLHSILIGISSILLQQICQQGLTETKENAVNNTAGEVSIISIEEPTESKRNRQNTPIDKKLDELLEESKRRREERIKQHSDKMERLDKLIEILERRKD